MDKTRALLLRLGIRSTLKGFHFLLYGLKLCHSSENYLLAVYKTLYVDIADHFGTSRDNVEHCIRTAITNCWYKGNRELLDKIAGYRLKHRPANGEFIDILYNCLYQEE
ncbi:sporulation initiation factor Spo0A C-terminal domain-containing protein [Dorea sp. D27]|uniref:sporulation initiation factor Spo0A C-terminal domain-containing protein n=1 Tax=Dorea sp. D27 TaxID=658665 RepID=UPI0006733620|nr:sporulation initiation factor Spo0A C-terminal domain-containing protein [Dorea sp. D27]KMZ52749.1 putative sporulation transcription factor Spo0A [Dorea sp. D27]